MKCCEYGPWLILIILKHFYILISSLRIDFNKNSSIFMQLGFSLSNWQKVQFNTDLFSDTQKYLYTEKWLD